MATVRKVFSWAPGSVLSANFTAPAGVFSLTATATPFTLPFATVGATSQSSLLLDYSGNVYAWGINASGQLGIGSVTSASSPTLVLGGLKFAQLAMGLDVTPALVSSFGLTPQGDAYGWGVNTNGQLGVGNVTPQSSPVAVVGGIRFDQIFPAPFGSFVCALAPSGKAYIWGLNTNGQVGNGNNTPQSSPIAVLGGLFFTSLFPMATTTPGGSVLGLATTGALYAWGSNVNGQLGVGDVTPRSSPVAVLGGLTFTSVVVDSGGVNSTFSCFGLTSAGALYAWGANFNGQLGVGDVNSRSSPVAVLGAHVFQSVVANNGSVLAITTAGAMYGWGFNSSGQLGVGNAVDRSSPVAVVGAVTFANAAIYDGIAFGTNTAGALYAWGFNGNGQLGVGDVASRSSPTLVLGGLTWPTAATTPIFAGVSATDCIFGVAATGTLYSWGLNAAGDLGIGNTTPQSSPIAVLGLRAPLFAATPNVIKIPVTPGTTYPVAINQGQASFGNTFLGINIQQLTLEFQQ